MAGKHDAETLRLSGVCVWTWTWTWAWRAESLVRTARGQAQGLHFMKRASSCKAIVPLEEYPLNSESEGNTRIPFITVAVGDEAAGGYFDHTALHSRVDMLE